jgi:asparagine synthase (glutamine-hydrolysing)
MCGIAGIALRDQPIDPAQIHELRVAVKLLHHRGPDGEGTCAADQVAFGHARLSILDLSAAGGQPMISPCGQFATTYNGECYNFREIAQQLRLEGRRSNSDTEVVLRAFAAEGPRCFERLNGIFAFAIHDRTNREVWLVRDRLGVKPLYYSTAPDRLCFASEVPALLALVGNTPSCETPLLHEWMYYGNSLGGKTLFRGIQQLLPGHALRLRLNDWSFEKAAYWSLSTQCRLPPPPERGAALASAVRTKLFDCVRRQLVSDVPIGVFLSGGVDSSAIASFAVEAAGHRIRTFSAGFDDPTLPDERPLARRLAERLGTEHHEFTIQGVHLEDCVEQLVAHHGAPFFDAANIPLWLMARSVAPSARVVLQGDGGDEVFGGYRRYHSIHHRQLLRALSFASKPLLAALPDSRLMQRARRYTNAFDRRNVGETMALLLTMEGADPTMLHAFGSEVRAAMNAANPLFHYLQVAEKFSQVDIPRRMSMVDLSIILPDIYLEKVDRSTMAHGVEVRVPFLDHDLIDFIVRLPADRVTPGGRTKWLLKAALRGTLPDEILDRPKSGFNVPFGRWLRGPLRAHFAAHLDAFVHSNPKVIDPVVIRRWIERDASGRVDLSSRLWKIYHLTMWANHFKVHFR